MMYKNDTGRKELRIIDPIKSNGEKNTPWIIWILPAANGLYFFRGWDWSASKSNRSLMIYIADAAKLNARKAKTASVIKNVLFNWWARRMGKKSCRK